MYSLTSDYQDLDIIPYVSRHFYHPSPAKLNITFVLLKGEIRHDPILLTEPNL
jgi:hypothetical protein